MQCSMCGTPSCDSQRRSKCMHRLSVGLALTTHYNCPHCLQVLITPHTAFLTSEALDNIASTTITNMEEFLQDKQLTNELRPKPQK